MNLTYDCLQTKLLWLFHLAFECMKPVYVWNIYDEWRGFSFIYFLDTFWLKYSTFLEYPKFYFFNKVKAEEYIGPKSLSVGAPGKKKVA